MARISIIIPVYNSEKYIRRCLNSILNQTFQDFEIILIDDNSKDNSLKIISEIEETHKDKIKVLKNDKNVGAGASRNKGLKIASGEYITFIDSDDYIEENTLKRMYESCVNTDSDIARINIIKVFSGKDISLLGRRSNIDEHKIIIPKEEISYLTEEYPGVTNKLFKRNLIGTVEFPENLKWEDYPFTIPLLYKANKVVTVPEKDARYNYSVNLSGTTIKDTKKVSKKMLDIFTCSDMIKQEIPSSTDKELEEQLNFLSIVNCLQRTRDILYSNIPYQKKKELITLVSRLIKVKYGTWQDNELYKKYKERRILYNIRMSIIEKYFIEEIEELSEKEIKDAITKKLEKI